MSGSKIDDHISSVELNRSALRWALKFLRSNGCFVAWAGKCWKLLREVWFWKFGGFGILHWKDRKDWIDSHGFTTSDGNCSWRQVIHCTRDRSSPRFFPMTLPSACWRGGCSWLSVSAAPRWPKSFREAQWRCSRLNWHSTSTRHRHQDSPNESLKVNSKACVWSFLP